MGARTRGFANNVLTAGKLDASDGLSGVVTMALILYLELLSIRSDGTANSGDPKKTIFIKY